MADLQAAIYTRCQAVAGLTALISTRLYPDAAPQDTAQPYVVYHILDTRRPHTFAGAAGFARRRVQFDIYAATSISREAVAEQLRLALDGFVGTVALVDLDYVLFDSEQDDALPPGDGSDVWTPRRVVDYIMWHRESVPSFS